MPRNHFINEDTALLEDVDQEYIKKVPNRRISINKNNEIRDVLVKSRFELAEIHPYSNRKLSDVYKELL